MKHLVLLSFIIAMPLSALACDRPKQPVSPGSQASTDQIAKSMNEVQAYIEAGMGYVECMQKKGESTKIVQEMNKTVDQHNQRIRAYHERLRIGQQQEIDKNQ